MSPRFLQQIVTHLTSAEKKQPTEKKKKNTKKLHNIQGQQDFYRSQSTSRSAVGRNLSHTQEVK